MAVNVLILISDCSHQDCLTLQPEMLQIRLQTERCDRRCWLGRHDHHPDHDVFHRVPHDAREYTSEVRIYSIDLFRYHTYRSNGVMTQLAHCLN